VLLAREGENNDSVAGMLSAPQRLKKLFLSFSQSGAVISQSFCRLFFLLFLFLDVMEECKIQLFRGKELLSEEQVAHVYKVLDKWKIMEVDEVDYYPESDTISLVCPIFKYGISHATIRSEGNRITNHWQLDGFDCVLTWRNEEEEKLERRMKKKQRKTNRDEPYPLRNVPSCNQ
jgi:hypothetical protein